VEFLHGGWSARPSIGPRSRVAPLLATVRRPQYNSKPGMATDRPVRADHGVKVVETRDARTIVLLVTALLLIAFAGIMVLVLALASPTPPPPPRVATAVPPSPSAAGAAAPEPSHTATAPTHASAPPPHENASAPHVRPLRPARPPASVGTAAT